MESLIYLRQQELPLHIPNHLMVVGCGGVGAWAALLAALSGVPKLSLVDPDTLEAHNLNRTPFTLDDCGKPKVEVLRDMIVKLRRSCLVYSLQAYGSPYLVQTLKPNIVLDCTDDPRAQRELFQALRGSYVRAGYNGGEHLTVSDTVPDWAIPRETSPRYEVVPSWSVPAVITAALALFKILWDRDFQVSGNISQLGGIHGLV